MEAIVVEGLCKSYGRFKAVDNVSFSVEAGETFGLLGPNGAGKTTTLEILEGLMPPTSGRVEVLGKDVVRDALAIRQRIGVQLQTTALFDLLTVEETVRLYAGLSQRSTDPERLLTALGLQDKRRTLARNLSGGEKQRLAIALALVNDPDIVFLDEPTTGLDPKARRDLWDIIREMKAAGKTVVLSTHYMEEADALCDRVAILDRGRIVALGRPAALVREHFPHSFIDVEAPGGLSEPQQAQLTAMGCSIEPVDVHRFRVIAPDVARPLERLLTWSSEGSLSLEQLTVRKASLEDLFIKLTGRRLQE